jgi:hypothetical protein
MPRTVAIRTAHSLKEKGLRKRIAPFWLLTCKRGDKWGLELGYHAVQTEQSLCQEQAGGTRRNDGTGSRHYSPD